MVLEVKRTIRVVTEQANSGKPAEMEGFPMKIWHIEIYLLNEAREEIPANIFTKAVYNLHPSFANPVQTFDKPPFRCENDGWGEFEMKIDLFTGDKTGKHTIDHDLNFMKPRYEAEHVITFKNPNSNLLNLLRQSGPVPGDDNSNGLAKKKDVGKKKKNPPFDMDKLADMLVKLQEDDLLRVVQLIHDHKTDETYIKNEEELGEFHVDLYTLPDNLTKMLWEFVQGKV